MNWPWKKRKHWYPPVRPPSARPITEFEERRLEEVGQWLTISIQVMPHGSWCNWKHNVPEELRTEAKDALIALALALQDKEKS